MNSGQLAGKVALITGAAAGIGAATARRFVQEGARVVIADIDEVAGCALARELGAAARFSSCDHTDRVACERAVDAALQAFGAVDILHNNAGDSRTAAFTDYTDDEVLRRLDVLLLGYWKMSRAALPALLESARRDPDGSVILMTSSVAAIYARANAAVYNVAKAGILGLMRTLAQEYGPHNVRVNSICPGAVDTGLLRRGTLAWGGAEVVLPKFRAETPLRRLAEVTDIANAALFLASRDARTISAHALVVDGGLREY